MMTPKMKEDFCAQILGASRQLFLSGRIVNALLGCHDLALSCCHEIARISVMECSL